VITDADTTNAAVIAIRKPSVRRKVRSGDIRARAGSILPPPLRGRVGVGGSHKLSAC
jgi:hypothetical protein